MACTYILYSSDLDCYYIGHTDLKIEERIRKHLSDHTGFTSKAKDWRLVFQRQFDTKKEAYNFECEIKGWKSRRAIENLINKT